MPIYPTPGAVLDYWIGPSTDDHLAAKRLHKRWFIKSPDTDRFIGVQFQPLLNALRDGLAEDWATQGPRQRLAAIIVLDQFSRNIFRGRAESFSYDHIALDLTLKGLDQNAHSGLSEVEQSFFYLPLEHSERLEDQDRSIGEFGALLGASRASFKPLLQNTLDYAHQHRVVIQQFGRFPHRNVILGRENTPDEDVYLSKPGAGF